MNLYRIVVAKDIFSKCSDPSVKKEIAVQFQLTNLFDKLNITDFYFSKHHESSIMIDEDAIEKLQLLTLMNYKQKISLDDLISEGNEFNPDDYSHFKVKSSEEVISIMKEHMQQDHIQKIKEFKREAAKKSSKRKELLKSRIHNQIDRNIAYKKVVSIDFEYINLDVFEFGISIHQNDVIKNYHYLVEENYVNKKTNPELQFKFEFGETKIIPEHLIALVLKEHLDDADYLLLHGHSNDYLILCKYGLDLNKEENLKIMDTILFYKEHFNKYKGEAANLKKMLSEFGIESRNLHNSGNDAVMTLKLFMEMHRQKVHKSHLKVVA